MPCSFGCALRGLENPEFKAFEKNRECILSGGGSDYRTEIFVLNNLWEEKGVLFDVPDLLTILLRTALSLNRIPSCVLSFWFCFDRM